MVDVKVYSKGYISDVAIARIKSRCAEVLAKKVAAIYNHIIEGERGRAYPYWSGSYISSWRISYGSVVDTGYNAPMAYGHREVLSEYAVPGPVAWEDVKARIENLIGNGSVAFVSNAAPHAMMVEHEGTPTHRLPWYVLRNAVHAASGIPLLNAFASMEETASSLGTSWDTAGVAGE